MKKFLDQNFLLNSTIAETLYHEYAENLPIIDYHCHLSVKDIFENTQFQNLTQLWLNGDHYKWRAMRANGIPEKLITGDGTDFDKFYAWAQTVPATLGNPLFHWTHLELLRYFNIKDRILNEKTGRDIYYQTEKLLKQDHFRVRGLLERMNVKIVCTTDDPLDNLEFHEKLRRDKTFQIQIFPAFRPDKALNFDNIEDFNSWVDKLEVITKSTINDFSTYIRALRKRHDFFHSLGCRLSDHGLEHPYSTFSSKNELEDAFLQIRSHSPLSTLQKDQLKTGLMIEFGKMNSEKNWVMQLHFGAIRNNNSLKFQELGPDSGYDSMGDFNIAISLCKFLNALESTNSLPKTIVYSINPKDNDVIATMLGSFQDGKVVGKMQMGCAWWFNDQKLGIENQLISLANHGLLSKFVGMLTDSRSFLSYPRHEYFRRILCNLIGKWVDKGEIPYDPELLGKLIQDVCYYNAQNYFNF
ncbi:Uronate isomerase [Candidatus Lokiarchaeum ossiferum]|uniref:Uronate isomerase n=1 Tax=Candidatus Lokiarchaeum ossiferum TaxID=2951803 RepID=A0ABY6HLU8_9ARCH|nr:Uronate isomerase [Candidatus Lokiarchaeum sp. B-35]